MTNRRVYRQPLSPKQAIDELWKHRNKQFDPRIVEQFINLLSDLSFSI
ncbi:MAG: hypothetical protein ANABAC_0433 [Anaerolineae bacterium]|nr:MAG: hypothetical protein ANABAC_0433 [Anaerolineae bacterium]